jgi:SAM-dependent methyltransferase
MVTAGVAPALERVSPEQQHDDDDDKEDSAMADSMPRDVWAIGAAYEPYVGRWSRLVAREFIAWLGVDQGGRWLDVGCGTGSLLQTILATATPDAVLGVDASAGFARYAREQAARPRSHVLVGDARALPIREAAFDAAVSGLMINFVPAPGTAVAEMARVARPGGSVAAYVWDYAGEMQLMRHFWDAAVALDPAAADLDEGRRFPLCRPEPLGALFRAAGLREVEVRAIDVPTDFRDFDDYWSPFLGGQGPAPTYAMSLPEARRATLRDRIRAGLPFAPDGSIRLLARAWAVRGRR